MQETQEAWLKGSASASMKSANVAQRSSRLSECVKKPEKLQDSAEVQLTI
jgi:hypothetical protein